MKLTESRRDWGGYTFVETLVGLAILTMAGGLILGALQTTERVSRKSLETLQGISAQRFQFDLLEDLCLRTLPPPWASQEELVYQAPGSFTFFYLDGRKEQTWSLEKQDTRWILRTSVMTQPLDLWNDLEFRIWEKDGRRLGLLVEFTLRNRKEGFRLPWGARPL